MDTTQSLFSQREAATYLNIDKNTLAKYRKLGFFNTIRLKQTILFTKEELDAFNEKFYQTRPKIRNINNDEPNHRTNAHR